MKGKKMNGEKTICNQCGKEARLISEDDAIGKTFRMTYDNSELVKYTDKVLQELTDNRKTKCISVDERLPDASNVYLVIRAERSGEQYHEVSGFYLSDMTFGKGDGFDNVTHWMPLPTPPVDEEVNDE